jgi:hypothetical protein
MNMTLKGVTVSATNDAGWLEDVIGPLPRDVTQEDMDAAGVVAGQHTDGQVELCGR